MNAGNYIVQFYVADSVFMAILLASSAGFIAWCRPEIVEETCSKYVDPPPEESAAKEEVCRNCGATLEAGDDFCTECGAKRGAQKKAVQDAQVEETMQEIIADQNALSAESTVLSIDEPQEASAAVVRSGMSFSPRSFVGTVTV